MKILITDDDKNLRKVLLLELSDAGFEVDEAESGLLCIEKLEKEEFDVILLDLNMPGLDGMEVLKRIKALDVSSEVIILTGHGTVTTAVEAMKLGAYDYLTKPFKIVELRVIIGRALEKQALVNENLLLKTQLKRQSQPHTILTRDPGVLGILDTVKKVALSDMPVLVTGESGVGKEIISRAIHREGSRSEKAFIPINCGSIPDNMLESELFGHERGSFTGAHSKKPGLLEIADKGILFLDEIGEMSVNLQPKLLRAIETGSFFRVGGVKEINVDVKFVSATNKDLEAEIEKNRFRADLYYRISALTIHIPPLRLRKGDIPLLAEHFIMSNSANKNRKFSRKAMDAFCEYSWPGNVRELQNIVNSIMLLIDKETIEPEDLPGYIMGDDQSSGKQLKDVEKDHILKVYKETGGHRGKTARVLGIDPKTLYRKLSDYGVKV
ncbi:MAG: sigma-54 dependent transcriptional regulator [Thermodesulfovibrionales bacterium]